MSNTSWWRLALAAPAISPDFALVSKHVCERGSTFAPSDLNHYFPSKCRKKIHHTHTPTDGLGHVGRAVVEKIADRRVPPGARYFQYVGHSGAYLRDVDGLYDGFAPSLYCHERDWVRSQCKLCRWPTGDAVFRDHFECFVAPPFDEWFGFDALPPADDPAWGRRAVAETSRRRRDAPSTAALPTASSASSSTCASAT
ncbi:hypothetical protein JL721_11843 [Aureococcus anophagefferens]|nr:hypothetical protein JL721_11843 [Aureococcus anophagefferens]